MGGGCQINADFDVQLNNETSSSTRKYIHHNLTAKSMFLKFLCEIVCSYLIC